MDAVQVVSVESKCMRKGQACEAVQVASCRNYKSDVVWWWQVTSLGSGPATAILETAIAIPSRVSPSVDFELTLWGRFRPMTHFSCEQRVQQQRARARRTGYTNTHSQHSKHCNSSGQLETGVGPPVRQSWQTKPPKNGSSAFGVCRFGVEDSASRLAILSDAAWSRDGRSRIMKRSCPCWRLEFGMRTLDKNTVTKG